MSSGRSSVEAACLGVASEDDVGERLSLGLVGNPDAPKRRQQRQTRINKSVGC